MNTRQSKRSDRTTNGFTLIQLLIVIAIIGILAAVVIPTFQSSIRKANEASAVTTVNTIKVAEAKYVIDHQGHYGTFSQLFSEGYLDKRFNMEKPHVRGYIFVLTLVDRNERAAISYQLNANPECAEGIGATGKIFYYSEPDAGVYVNRDGVADAEDEIL
jgi:prepilin-type N-terminal cleavage/methylation domain-containing protein